MDAKLVEVRKITLPLVAFPLVVDE